LHVVDPQTGTVRDLGRIGPRARSPVWWQADGSWHLAYLARPEALGGYGGYAVYDVAVTAAAAVHRDLTEGMAVCPADLAQVAPWLRLRMGLFDQRYRQAGTAGAPGGPSSPSPGRTPPMNCPAAGLPS
jgi:hypothetical protein